jgi:tetratricopeptide (TPR) repeat protein
MGKKPRIVLTMIVKNEAKVIRRCLGSIKKYIDAWAISDTGSTDGTQEIIRQELAGIPGVLLERPWVDFATNRNEAIEAAAEFNPDYCLTLDADEELTIGPGFSLRDLTCETYDAMFQIAGTTGKWPRKFLFQPHLRYRYVLDEVLEQGKTHAILPACLVESHTDGARSADGLIAKYNRDVEVLQRAVEREPNESRYWYYLAQRLAGAKRYEEAIQAYERRIELPGGMQAERGYSQLMIGQCLEEIGAPFEAIQAAYLKSWQLYPHRAETLFALGCVHSVRGEHALAELYARAAQKVPRPTDPLPADESIYAFRAVDLLAGALSEQGKLDEALDLLEKLYALPQLPDEERGRVLENINKIKAAQAEPDEKSSLGPDERVYENQADMVRRHGFGGFRRMGLEFLNSFQAQSLPSPLRWLWLTLCALIGTRAASVAGAVATVPVTIWALQPLNANWAVVAALLAVSPLLFLAARRRLQDGLVAALTLAATGFALRADPYGLGAVLFALVAVKEASVLCVPAFAVAWWIGGGTPIPLLAAIGAAGLANGAALLALFRGMLPAMLKGAAGGHATPYTLDHQRGSWHRLLVDLVMVSPVTTLAALFGPWQLLLIAATLLGAHAIAPVRNVRLVIAVDVLLRVAAVIAFGWWVLPAAAIDIYISRKLRLVYDPVTAALASQLGMSR